MYVVNISKDLVFFYLNDNADVYAFDSCDEETLSLKYETVEDILKIKEDKRYVFFIIKEKESEQ